VWLLHDVFDVSHLGFRRQLALQKILGSFRVLQTSGSQGTLTLFTKPLILFLSAFHGCEKDSEDFWSISKSKTVMCQVSKGERPPKSVAGILRWSYLQSLSAFVPAWETQNADLLLTLN